LYLFVLIFKQNFTLSHVPQRKEKDCLNCGTIVQGKYCHVCGQENVVPKESFWHMVTHFSYDITHFDSKFFTTLKDLLFKPGYLSKEYMAGRRASYLHPVKMYVFTSALFFLLFFSFFSPNTNLKDSDPASMTGTERLEELDIIEKKLKKNKDREADSVIRKKLDKLAARRDTTLPVSRFDFEQLDSTRLEVNISGVSHNYKTVAEYDSIQQTLSSKERDGWLMRRLVRKEISVNNKYRYDPEAGVEKLMDSVIHRLPYMLFISLPLFALILKLLYIRRKNFYYADHGVFTIHLYIFTFILLLVAFAIGRYGSEIWGPFGLLVVFLILWLFVYLYLAMRRFYGQSRWKTAVKFLFTTAFSLLMMMILLAIFLFFSAFGL
jgi:hypothetical protein